MPFTPTAVLAGLALLLLAQGLLCAQTYVQIAELNPNNPIGPRMTSSVTQTKLSRNLFGVIGDKVTYIWAPDYQSGWTAYEFATDEAWNRVLFGQKDIYIHGVSEVQDAAPFLGPAGLDYASGNLASAGGLTLYVADRGNARIVRAFFDDDAESLTAMEATPLDPDLNGVADVAYSGDFYNGNVYAVSVTGRVSYWCLYTAVAFCDFPGGKRWAYGSRGSSTGQFVAPKGICVGHAVGPDGGSSYTSDFYVADGGNRRLVWLRNGSTGPTWMGTVTLPNSGVPLSCAVDHFGNVTVADSLNSRLVKYTWNLGYLDSYGSYGVGATNHNTFAHPHSVDVPFGVKGDQFGWVWYGDGRVITAEDWGTQSGAREHYLGIKSTITAQPYYVSSTGHWDFAYSVTDHAYHQGVNVIDANGNVVRWNLAPTGLQPPGAYTADWDGYTTAGSLAPDGYYRFRVRVVSAYLCGSSSWCDQTLTSGSFHWTPPSTPVSVSISGPTTIKKVGTYTWTTTVSGGNGTYSYTWERSDDGGPYSVVGNASSYSSVEGESSGGYSFDLRVTVASGGQTAVDYHAVNVIIGP